MRNWRGSTILLGHNMLFYILKVEGKWDTLMTEFKD
jgi:hypothetical protein